MKSYKSKTIGVMVDKGKSDHFSENSKIPPNIETFTKENDKIYDIWMRKRNKLVKKKFTKGLNSSEQSLLEWLRGEIERIEKVEAERIGAVLEASLSMPIDEGERTIKHLDSIIKHYEEK